MNYYDFYKAPFCKIKIVADEKGVSSIVFVKNISKPNPNKITRWALKEIDLYFKKGNLKFTFPVSFQFKGFQKKVMDFIKKIPYGSVCSYEDVAKGIGNKRAFRAVGQALKRNPLPILFPCHRIIRKDGSLGGFTGGLKTKENLLKLEGFINEKPSSFV
ncbi:MAG: methylated-DNA--[protein]-cysteine S-methyltransferase [Thermoanaerobaculia bacterium]